MKKIITAVLLFCSALGFAAQPTSGSKSAYRYDDTQIVTPAPSGYCAFYINYIGRHGSRFISKPQYEQITYQTLLLANKQNQLTLVGQQLLNQMEKIVLLNEGKYGELTNLGRQDMTKIGERVLANNRAVFTGNKIAVLSTTSPRAKESAALFLTPFLDIYPHVIVKQQAENEQYLLRFFDYSPAYAEFKKSKTVKELIQSIEQSPQTQDISSMIAKRIFTDEFIKQRHIGINNMDKEKINITEFSIALFAVYQELLSFTPEELNINNINFDPFITDTEKTWLTTVITAKNYLQIGPAFNINGIQIKIAAPLLQEILDTSQQAINSGDIDANLYFAHAETLSPLATLLELDNANRAIDATSFFQYPDIWLAQEIIPMGANIQFIFYQHSNPDKPILVKVLLNEHEKRLPIQTSSYPYYDWNDVKVFYQDKINSMGLTHSDSAISYLNDLK